MTEFALGVIDAQSGFMPEDEGLRLQRCGFGQLPVPDGQAIVEPLNLLLRAFADHHLLAFTTQDWHPEVTAHFSDDPDYKTNWPRHCVAGTPGANLHPGIVIPAPTVRFIKGNLPLQPGEADTSYSAYYAVDPCSGDNLPYFLESRQVGTVALAGLATDYCVGLSALDLRTKLGLEVTIVSDASRGITLESTTSMLDDCRMHGITITTTHELLAHLHEG